MDGNGGDAILQLQIERWVRMANRPSLASREADEAVEVSGEAGGFGVDELQDFAGAFEALDQDLPLAARKVVGAFEAILPPGFRRKLRAGAAWVRSHPADGK